MSYIKQFEAELVKKLNSKDSEQSIVKWICEAVLTSYKNGIKAGQKGEVVARDGQTRRKSYVPTAQ